MDEMQRRAAAGAVKSELEARGWNAERLATAAGIGVEAVRDFLSGRRWPWQSKRNAMERALGWERGRIAEIADDAAQQADPVVVGLNRSELSAESRYKVLELYLALLQEERRDTHSASA